jgi:glutamate racemase
MHVRRRRIVVVGRRIEATVGVLGVFDSGIGGLTVLGSLVRRFPDCSFLYLGDTARVPYGTRDNSLIVRYTRQCLGFLESRGVDSLVVACHTASACAVPALRDEFNVPVLDVVGPAAQEAARITATGRVGIIGTRATVESNAYVRYLRSIAPGIEAFSQACPLLVPLVEEGWLHGSIVREIVAHYLTPLGAHNIDTLILGCTHYPLLKPVIDAFLGGTVQLVEAGPLVADELSRKQTRAGRQGNPQSPRVEVLLTAPVSGSLLAVLRAAELLKDWPITVIENDQLELARRDRE